MSCIGSRAVLFSEGCAEVVYYGVKVIDPLSLPMPMARTNMPSKANKKKNPTVTRLSFECPAGGATQFIDIGMALSAVNRKFFRAGLFYYVNSIEIYNDEQGVVDLLTAPDNWVTRNAHTRGSKLFDKMNSMVDYPVSQVGEPTYHDYKVYLNSIHTTTGTLSPSLYTVNAAAQTINSDDWVYSVFTSADDDQDPIADADEFTTHLVGGNTGADGQWESIGLIRSYSQSRNTVPATSPDDANISTSDPLMQIFDFSSEEQMNDIIDNLREDNDAPPYDYNIYVGEENTNLQHVARVGTEVGLGRVGRASGFCVPYGLICIDPHSFAAGSGTAFRVVVNVAAGNYKGVYAERA